MGRNLGPLNIKDSYEGLVQISGSSRDTLTDGSGSVITNLNVTSSFALTASFAENVVPTPTGSFMITGSVVDATLAFLKGDGTTFPLTVNNVANAVSSSHAVQADNALTATSASHALVADSALTATSSSHAVSSDTSISASHAVQADNALTATSASHAIFADNAISASYAPSEAPFPYTGSAEITGSLVVSGSIITGLNNTVGNTTATNAIIGGTGLTGGASIDNSLLMGGLNNTIGYGDESVIIGGESNTTEQNRVAIIGGFSHKVTKSEGGIFVGNNNEVRQGRGVVLGGNDNTISNYNGNSSAILSGGSNQARGNQYAAIIAGQSNSLLTSGSENTGPVSGSAIVGGISNTIVDGQVSAIIGGENHYMDGVDKSVIIGGSNISASVDSTAYVPNLNISGSLTDSDGNIGTVGQVLTSNGTDKVQWDTAAGGAAFPYTGSAQITGSLGVTGSLNVSNGTITSPSGYDIMLSGDGNTVTGGNNVIIGGFSSEITAGVRNVIVGGNDQQISSTGNNNVIIGGIGSGPDGIQGTVKDSVMLANRSSVMNGSGRCKALIAARNSTIGSVDHAVVIGSYLSSADHIYSVVIGGTSLTTTKSNEVVVPDLSVYGETFISSSTLGTGSLIDNLGQQALPGNDSIEHIVSLTQAEYDALTPDVNTLYVISGSTAGGAAFPFTGSAEITGSLGVTGSIEQGETNSNLGTNTAILSSGHSLISASVVNTSIIASSGSYQSSTQPGRTAIIASDNSYIDSTSAGNNDDIALIGTLNSRFTGGGARQAVIAGTNNAYNNGSRFSFIGGGESHVMEGYYANAIVGGSGNRMIKGTNSTIAGGGSNRVGNTTQTDYGFIGGGSNNFLDGDNSAIIAGTNGDNNHDRSVILGGASLATTKNDEVVVPSLDINGTVVQNVQALTITSNTASLDASTGQMFTLGLQNGVDTLLELSNQVAGQTFSLKITNNATSAGTITFDPQFDFEGGTPFTATATTNAVDILTFTTFDGSNVQCVGSKNFS